MRWVILAALIGFAVHALVPLVRAPYPEWTAADWARVLPQKDK